MYSCSVLSCTIVATLVTLLTIHAVESYILLTANLEDVHAIAKQLAESPVADQLKKIWRRASNQFSMQLARNRPRKRTDDDPNSAENDHQPNDEDNADRPTNSGEANGIERRSLKQPTNNEDKLKHAHLDISALGKNASFYLSSIKKIMSDI